MVRKYYKLTVHTGVYWGWKAAGPTGIKDCCGYATGTTGGVISGAPFIIVDCGVAALPSFVTARADTVASRPHNHTSGICMLTAHIKINYKLACLTFKLLITRQPALSAYVTVPPRPLATLSGQPITHTITNDSSPNAAKRLFRYLNIATYSGLLLACKNFTISSNTTKNSSTSP